MKVPAVPYYSTWPRSAAAFCLGTVILALAAVTPAAAETAAQSRMAVAEELVLVLGVPRQLDDLQMFLADQLINPPEETLAMDGAPDGDLGTLSAPSPAAPAGTTGQAGRPPPLAPAVVEAFAARLAVRRPAMLTEIATVYAERFTLAELKTLLTFYRTTAGARLISLSPELIQRTTDIGMQHGQVALDEVAP
jgi:hypothetical protein